MNIYIYIYIRMVYIYVCMYVYTRHVQNLPDDRERSYVITAHQHDRLFIFYVNVYCPSRILVPYHASISSLFFSPLPSPAYHIRTPGIVPTTVLITHPSLPATHRNRCVILTNHSAVVKPDACVFLINSRLFSAIPPIPRSLSLFF